MAASARRFLHVGVFGPQVPGRGGGIQFPQNKVLSYFSSSYCRQGKNNDKERRPSAGPQKERPVGANNKPHVLQQASSTPRRPRQNRWQPALIGRQPSRWSGQRMGRGDRFRHNSSGGTESSRPNGTRSSKFWPPPKRAGRRRVPVRPRCQSRRLPSSRRPKR